jgi:hypothetical protein
MIEKKVVLVEFRLARISHKAPATQPKSDRVQQFMLCPSSLMKQLPLALDSVWKYVEDRQTHRRRPLMRSAYVHPVHWRWGKRRDTAPAK